MINKEYTFMTKGFRLHTWAWVSHTTTYLMDMQMLFGDIMHPSVPTVHCSIPLIETKYAHGCVDYA